MITERGKAGNCSYQDSLRFEAMHEAVYLEHGYQLAVELSADDPLPGRSVVVYQAKTVYRPWLVERLGSVREATLNSVFAVMVGYLDH